MKLLNYSHPLSNEAHALLTSMVGEPVEETRVPVRLHFDKEIAGQLAEVVAHLLQGVEWGLVIPPAHAIAAVGSAMRQLSSHPRIVVMKPVGLPVRFVPAEVLHVA